MDVIVKCCAGLDVHKKTIMACVRRLGKNGRVKKEVRQFNTMTRGILAMSDWMIEEGVTHVAMESTGVFWKPVYNIIEEHFEVMLCNATHIKQVPGRKTDVKDCEWIAQLLQHGLLKGSFIPPKPVRELRDLTRHRAQITKEKTSVVNRIHKTLEDANIKLNSVASDIMGRSGRDMIQAFIRGETEPAEIAELARRKLRGKIPQLKVALEGRMTDHHRFMLRTLYEHVMYLERVIESLNTRIEQLMAEADRTSESTGQEFPLFLTVVALLMTIPGVDERAAQDIVAEIGTDMSVFPTEGNLASWAGVSPGNNESAGKKKRGKTTKGNRWLRRSLSQAAWAAGRTKGTYLSAQYKRFASRRGSKRAIVAVAHTILGCAYFMIKNHQTYQDLGPDFFDCLASTTFSP